MSAAKARRGVVLSRAWRGLGLGSEDMPALPGWVARSQVSLHSSACLTVRGASEVTGRWCTFALATCTAYGARGVGWGGISLTEPDCQLLMSQTRISRMTPWEVRNSKTGLLS